MSQLLELSEAETEEFLSQMVVSGAVQAKTDRLEGIVSFIKVSVGWGAGMEIRGTMDSQGLGHYCQNAGMSTLV